MSQPEPRRLCHRLPRSGDPGTCEPAPTGEVIDPAAADRLADMLRALRSVAFVTGVIPAFAAGLCR